MSDKPSFFAELRRRHIWRVAIAYAVTAWLLLQLAAIVLPSFGAPHWVLRVLIGLFVICFPLALLLAWAFEITPEGVRRTESAPPDETIARHGRRHVGQALNVAIVVVLAAAVGVLTWRLTNHRYAAPQTAGTKEAVPAPSTAVPAKSIAVLPFENLSADKDNGYFADGIQDLILSKLAEIGGLTVISRTSTMRYQSHPEDLKAIGRQLGVANLLEGSVQKAGNQVLINVQLIDARTDHHLWAKSYTRTLDNVFGVEGEVAEKVAASLKAKLDPDEQARVTATPTHNSAAYDAYLRGLSLETGTSAYGSKMLEIAEAYRKAVKLDPRFALAWAHLASIDSQLHFSLVDYTPARLAQARAALERARALAPDATATRIAIGDLAYYGHYDYPRALAAYRKVLQVSPSNALALANIGYVNRREGHWQRAIGYLERSLALDPRNVNTLNGLAWSYACLHRYHRARAIIRQALAINPGDPDVTGLLGWTYQSQGDVAESAKILDGVPIPPNDWGAFPVLVYQAWLSGNYPDAVHVLKTALATGKHLSRTARAQYYQFLGFAEHLAGDPAAARLAYRRAISISQAAPNSPVVLVARAKAQAGLGQKAAALATFAQAKETTPARNDIFQNSRLDVALAQIDTLLGDDSRAIATLRRLLAMAPGSVGSMMVTPALLRIDPNWNPLRKDPEFQALLKQYPAAPANATDSAAATHQATNRPSPPHVH